MDLSLFDIAITWANIVVGAVVFALMIFMHHKGTLSEPRLKKMIFALAGIFVLVTAAKIATHYFILASDTAFGAFLLPPHQPWDWFVWMAIKRYLFPLVAALAAGLCMYFIATRVNKTFRGDLFVEQDKYIFLCAALIVGWPNFVLYLVAAVVLTVFLSGVATLRHGADTRIVLTDALLYAILATFILDIAVGSMLPLQKLTIFA